MLLSVYSLIIICSFHYSKLFIGGVTILETKDSLIESFFTDSGNSNTNLFVGISEPSCESKLLSLEPFVGIKRMAGGEVVASVVLPKSEFLHKSDACATVFFYPIGTPLTQPKAETNNLDDEQFTKWLSQYNSVTFHIVNEFKFPVEVYWSDENGNSVSQAVLEPGGIQQMNSLLGHIFLAHRISDGMIVDYFIANGRNYHMFPSNRILNCEQHMIACFDMEGRLAEFTATVWADMEGKESGSHSVQVKNEFNYPVELFWTDKKTSGAAQGVLQPGDGFILRTNIGHTFYARRLSDNSVVDYFAIEETVDVYVLRGNNRLQSCDQHKIGCLDMADRLNNFRAEVQTQRKKAMTTAQLNESLKARERERERESEKEKESVTQKKSMDIDGDVNIALIGAAHHGDIQLINLALEKGAEINYIDKHGWSPIMMASYYGQAAALERLIAEGANVNFHFKNGWSALTAACESGHVEAATVLLNYGAHVDSPDENGWTPLIASSRYGRLEVVSLLLSKHADVNYQGQHGFTALMAASDYGHTSVVEMLVEAGAKVNIQDKIGISPLMCAARNGHKDTAILLLDHKAEMNLLDKNGWTALTLATQNGRDEVVSVLMTRGADVNKEQENGLTPLMFASKNSQTILVSKLLDIGANINGQNKDGKTALQIASETANNAGVVSLLLERGAAPNHVDKDGKSALCAGTKSGSEEIVSMLLENGALVNLQSERGSTALMRAAENGHIGLISLLLSKNADINVRNHKGQSALDLAEARGQKKAVELLKAKGAKPRRKFFFF